MKVLLGYLAPMVNAVEADVWITRSTLEGDGDGVPDCYYCAVRSVRSRPNVKNIKLRSA